MKKTYLIKSFDSEKETDWSVVPVAKIGSYGWQSAEKFEAQAQLVLIKGSKFICRMVCFQADPWANCDENGGRIWLDSVMELFISFDGKSYLNVEMNSRGDKLEEFGPSRRDRRKLGGITTVSAEKRSDSWQLELVLPVSGIQSLYPDLDAGLLKKGFELALNFYKTGLNPETGLSHYGMWNPVESEKPDFHRPDQFGSGIIA